MSIDPSLRTDSHASDVFVEITSWLPPLTAEITIDAADWRGYRFTLVLGGEGAQLSSVEVHRDDGSLPLNAWRLQHIPLALLERALSTRINDLIEGWDDVAGRSLFGADDWPEPGQRTRANRDDIKLARLARDYVDTLGQPQQTRTLAERYGYAPGSIGSLIRRARKRHLLTSTSKGRPGGRLTPRARALLDNISDKQLREFAAVERKRQRVKLARVQGETRRSAEIQAEKRKS